MRLSTLNTLIITGISVISLLNLAASELAHRAVDEERELQEQRETLLHGTDIIAKGSDLLTENIRAYAATGDPQYRAAFFSEVTYTKMREHGTELLRENGATDYELQLIQQAKLNSDALIGLENKAMTAAEEGNYSEAISYVYGTNYQIAKQRIMAPIQSVKQMIDSRLSQAILIKDRTSHVLNSWHEVFQLVNLVVILSAFLFFFRTQLVKPVVQLAGRTKMILAGDTSVEIPYTDLNNEIGNLASSLDTFRVTHLAIEEQRWIKQGISEISIDLQNASSVESFGDHLLRKVAPMLHVGIGAFYLQDETGKYAMAAGYGVDTKLLKQQKHTPSLGLIEQAMESGEPILIREIPEGYFAIESGVGSAKPDVLLVVPLPLSSEHRLDGAVIELAGFTLPNNQQWKLLDELVGVVGPLLEILLRSVRTRELLAKTRQQAAEVRESRTKYLQLIDDIGDQYTVFSFDAQGQITYVSKGFETIFGISREEVIGEIWSEKVNWEPSSLEQSLANAKAMLEGEADAVEQQVEFTRPDGTKRVLHSVSHARFDSEGKALAIEGVLQDITERIAAEQLILEAKQAAEQATRAKSDFLANMSHEIRTPMNAIIGMTHLTLETELQPNQRRYLEKVNGAAENLLQIINDILDFSKIEAGKLAIEEVDFYLDDVLENTFALVAMRAEEKGLELLYDADPNVPAAFRGDPLRLGQVLINIANNAVKFTEKGEIVLAVAVEQLDDELTELHFSVRDTGIGMTQEQSERLFQSFSQADTSVTRKYGGTGLGLAISKRLVGLMGGRIWAESEYGKGSTFHFTVRFPVSQEVKPRRMLHAEELRGLQALVVDNNASAREILSSMLSALNLQVVAVDNAEAALTSVEAKRDKGHNFDLILMDWNMPGMSGVECAKELGHMDPQLLERVIMVTAYGSEEVYSEAEQLGIRLKSVLSKPVTQSALLETIAGLLGRENLYTSLSQGKAKEQLDAETQLTGARVLLVEDNDLNAELATELLTRVGMSVDLAINGQVALDMLAQDDQYDGILMDCQMPVMDGYTATRKIRENPSWSALPILAMTANTMAGEREKVIEAGMNEHIAKPLKIEQLYLTLAQWIKPQHTQTRVAGPEQNNSKLSASFNILNAAGIDTQAGLNTSAGNEQLYRRILEKFLNSQASFVEQFEQALTDKDSELATRLAHTLKGNAGNIGAGQLAEAAKLLELDAKALQEGAQLSARLAEVEQALNPVLASLSELFSASENGAESASLANNEVSLDSLAALVSESDPVALEMVASLIEENPTSEQRDLLIKVQAALNEFDFDKAETLLG